MVLEIDIDQRLAIGLDNLERLGLAADFKGQRDWYGADLGARRSLRNKAPRYGLRRLLYR
jgi:hypothetical protein